MQIVHAINTYGAEAVYVAAHRHMGGDARGGLATVGLQPRTMGDVWRAMSAAYAALGSAARALDCAQAPAALETM